jgi:flagellar biosynthesis protein
MAADEGSQPQAARAVALSYGARDAQAGRAPRVVASGRAKVAEAIIARALEHGVPVHQSRELVALLMHFDLDERIPPALYVAVAEVLVWARRLETTLGGAAPTPARAAPAQRP